VSEWWTYAPSDFLLFSARTWYRLVARYNADLWPLQAVALAVGLLLLVLVARGSDPRGRIVGIVLAASWVVVGYAFHHERHAEVNWAASGFAVASFVQAALLAVAAFAGNGLALRRPVRLGDRIALLVAALAIVAYPLVSVATGRGIAAGETFGTLPDPTAIASVALLSLAQARRRWVVLAIPIATCAIASIFLHALRAAEWPEWPLPLAAAVVAVVAARRVR
jgi:hypothetical protein